MKGANLPLVEGFFPPLPSSFRVGLLFSDARFLLSLMEMFLLFYGCFNNLIGTTIEGQTGKAKGEGRKMEKAEQEKRERENIIRRTVAKKRRNISVKIK